MPFGAKPTRISAFIGVSILLNADALANIAMPTRASTFDSLYRNSINDDALLDADALAGIAMPARASACNSIDTLMNAEALAGFAL